MPQSKCQYIQTRRNGLSCTDHNHQVTRVFRLDVPDASARQEGEQQCQMTGTVSRLAASRLAEWLGPLVAASCTWQTPFAAGSSHDRAAAAWPGAACKQQTPIHLCEGLYCQTQHLPALEPCECHIGCRGHASNNHRLVQFSCKKLSHMRTQRSLVYWCLAERGTYM